MKYGCNENELGHYTCYKTNNPLVIDGRLSEEAWEKAPKSPRFVDMVTGAPGFFDTYMAALWDNDYLYIGYWIEEPNIQAHFTERDSPVYFENDIEIFIGGNDCYYEFQINALGTLYEVFYIWQDAYKKGSRFDIPEFDLYTRSVDVIGGFQDYSRYKKHPRGRRWAFMDWDFPGLKSAVHIDGTLNDPSQTDKGWNVIVAFPWKGMKLLNPHMTFPPKTGDTMRFDFSRFEKLDYNNVVAEQSPGWSFNKHGVYDSHIPECFTFVHFSEEIV